MITLFYGSQVYGTFIAWKEMYNYIEPGDDVYEGGYVYAPNPITIPPSNWFRCDGTPEFLEDVPKVLQMLALVLNL